MVRLFCYCLLFAAFLSSCNNEKKFDITSNDNYEKGKVNLEEVEKKNPARFLTVTGGSKKNLMKQTVIKGRIKNNAKIVTYKDINIKLTFYSKTGALLEQDEEVIYETIPPGGLEVFKTKFFAPKGTDSVAMQVLSAKY